MSQDRDYLTEAIEAVRDALYRGDGRDLPAGLAEVAVHVAAPIIERAMRREGICGDQAPTMIRTEEGDESGAGVICELTHGHKSEWHEAPSIPDPLLPPMRWRNSSVTISGTFGEAK